MAVCVDLGAADLDGAGGKALCSEAAQRDGLGVVPRLLGERLAGAQGPVGADRIALRLCRRIVRDGARIAELHVAHLGDLARRHGDDDLARRLGAFGRLVELQRQRGREVAERAEQLARVRLGGHHEARDLGGAEIVELAIALDLEVQLQIVAHRLGAAHVDGEGIALRAGLALVVLLAGAALVLAAVAVGRGAAAHNAGGGPALGGLLAFSRQQAAALQKQDA